MDIRIGQVWVCLLLAGCTMGPDFAKPDATTPDSYIRGASSGEHASNVVEGEAINPEWWSLLHDPLLDKLVARVADENLDIQTATAQIEESRAQRGITASEFYPQVNGDASYNREKLSDKGVISLISGGGASGGGSGGAGASSSPGIPSSQSTPAFNVYQYGFDVSWEIDLWGRVRRGVEAADANLQASKEERRGLVISMIAELVRDYVQLRGTQEDLADRRKELEDARRVDSLVQERAKAGLTSTIDVANIRAQTAALQAQIPQLEQQEAVMMNAIALLLAQPPGALETELSEIHPVPPVPPQVPIGVPSELIRRRPDIRQAEAQLHAATAQIGVAEADFFPKLTLMGDGMLQSLHLSDLNTWAARSYTFGPSVSLPIFEGGRLSSTLAMRNAEQHAAAIRYSKTILTAFHEVDNALTAFRAEQQRRAALETETKQIHKALNLAIDLYKHGLSDFLTVLTDKQKLLESEEQMVQSTEATTSNMVQLYKALGGGWGVSFPEPQTNNR